MSTSGSAHDLLDPGSSPRRTCPGRRPRTCSLWLLFAAQTRVGAVVTQELARHLLTTPAHWPQRLVSLAVLASDLNLSQTAQSFPQIVFRIHFLYRLCILLTVLSRLRRYEMPLRRSFLDFVYVTRDEKSFGTSIAKSTVQAHMGKGGRYENCSNEQKKEHNLTHFYQNVLFYCIFTFSKMFL